MSRIPSLRVLAGGAVAGSVLLPRSLVRSGVPVCTFRAVTGLPCPTCGLTRSWNAMGHLEFDEARRFHPLGPLTFAGATLMAIAGEEATLGYLKDGRWRQPLIGLLLVGWVAAWLTRLGAALRG